MNYIMVAFTMNPPEPTRDILIARLGEIGFESFEETTTGLRAFIPEDDFSEKDLKNIDALKNNLATIRYELQSIADQNWNAVWESDFQPIEVNEHCRVRAPFHPSKDLKFEIVIDPKMSFGTGHHETTFLMMQQMFRIEMEGLDVLDMGTGTGVLAILAAKMGARKVVAIDVDDWAFENALENVALNQAVDIAVEKGAADQIKQRTFQVILANINKNVLLHDMQIFASSLETNGKLLLSGFFESDIVDLEKKAKACGLQLRDKSVKNDWAVLELDKIN